jgi:F-type H+-transporting ATPase subunit delta
MAHLRSKAAPRYAQALLDLARERACAEPVRSDLAGIREAIRVSPDLARFLPNHALGRQVREKTVRALFYGKVHPLTFQFLMLVEGKKRLGLLGDIADSFLEQYDRMKGIVKGRVTSAHPLPEEIVREITAKMRSRTPGDLVLSSSLDEKLLGGFKVQVNDVVYDFSVLAQLRRVKEIMCRA